MNIFTRIKKFVTKMSGNWDTPVGECTYMLLNTNHYRKGGEHELLHFYSLNQLWKYVDFYFSKDDQRFLLIYKLVGKVDENRQKD